MKKLFCFLSMITLLILSAIPLIAQSDTTLNFNNVSQQVTSVIQASAGHDLTWKIMLFSAIAGVLIRIVVTTMKGVKNQMNESPMQFAFSYWIKDNILPKITTLLTFIVSTNIFIKLPTGTLWYIIFGVIGLIAGLFLDWLTDVLKLISPKIK